MLAIAGVAPGISGLISKVEARLQGRTGPRVAQPYYDLARLFRMSRQALLRDQVRLYAAQSALACCGSMPTRGRGRRSAPGDGGGVERVAVVGVDGKDGSRLVTEKRSRTAARRGVGRIRPARILTRPGG